VTRSYFSFAALGLIAALAVPFVAGAEQGVPQGAAVGSVRIGLVKPTVQMGSGDTAQASETIRKMLSEYLSGPTMQVTLLEARLPDQFEEEARRAGCNYILSTEIVHHRGRAGAGTLSRALGNFGYLPAKDAITSVVLSGAVRTAADVASSIKAKDEMQLEFLLRQPGASTPLLTKKMKGRAKTDGEDVLTPLIAKAATEIGGAVSKH
jgi:hypothetical protein